jgi:hypothetical protein
MESGFDKMSQKATFSFIEEELGIRLINPENHGSDNFGLH